MKSKRIESMNEFVQTNMDKGVADSAAEAPVSRNTPQPLYNTIVGVHSIKHVS